LNAKYAIEFMTKSQKEKKPFVCYVPFGAVHGPHVVKEDLLKRVPSDILSKVKEMKPFEYYKRAVVNMEEWRKFNAKYYNDESWLKELPKLTPEETAMLYSAMLISLDDNVGVIMDYLKKNKLLENTIVLFFSDNGGTEYAGNNSPFSGFKHSLLEGGIHAAAAMMIPEKVIPVTTKEVNSMCGYLDVLPTMAELSKSKQKLPTNIDGVSLVNQIKGKVIEQPERYYYWAWRDHDVIRSNKWKIFRYINKVLLYDIENDIAEKTDVSEQNPEVVKQMMNQLNIEAKRNGAAYSHFPLQISVPKPKPFGNVMAIDIESDQALSRQNQLVFDFEFSILPDCYLEYDIMVDTIATLSHAYFTIMRKQGLIFDNNGVNVDGKLLRLSASYAGVWKRVAVGLCSFAPTTVREFGLGFKFKSPGKIKVYIDNVRIKNMKGDVVHEIFVDKFNEEKLVSKKVSIVKL